jgi:N-acyl-D-aspartate/D-glutamate deacylase
LQHWVRDTATFDVAEGVRRLTSAPADVIGFGDVGRIGVGCRADVNVIDLDAVTPLGVEYVYDFPGGAGRFVQQARGYDATVVNGVVVAEDGQLTGARGGAVLRAGRAA